MEKIKNIFHPYLSAADRRCPWFMRKHWNSLFSATFHLPTMTTKHQTNHKHNHKIYINHKTKLPENKIEGVNENVILNYVLPALPTQPQVEVKPATEHSTTFTNTLKDSYNSILSKFNNYFNLFAEEKQVRIQDNGVPPTDTLNIAILGIHGWFPTKTIQRCRLLTIV